MKKAFSSLLIYLLGLLTITACSSISSGIVVPTPIPSATPLVTAEHKSLPTPVSSGQMIMYNDLLVTMDQAEITGSYLTEFGSNREPTGNIKFLWIHIVLKNMGQKDQELPASEHFSVLSGTTEFKSAYGYRKDYADYMALNMVLKQGMGVDAWLRFDIPADQKLTDLTVAFLPESTQVSFGFSSNEYPWADHPIYLWNCMP